MDIQKNPGADWYVYYIDVADGEREVMSVFGFPTVEAACAEAREDLNDGCRGEERDWFEIIAVVRVGVTL